MPRPARDVGASPFIKWVGGKRSLLEQLRPHLPPTYGRLFEPFVGGGALFFDQRPKRATLGDNNARLIATYRGLRDATDEVIRLLKSYRYDRDDFLAMRARAKRFLRTTRARARAGACLRVRRRRRRARTHPVPCHGRPHTT